MNTRDFNIITNRIRPGNARAMGRMLQYSRADAARAEAFNFCPMYCGLSVAHDVAARIIMATDSGLDAEPWCVL